MSDIAVSVIIPIYNAAKYFDRCVRSLFEQTSDNMEYIFVNDCTPDNCLEILYQLMELYPHRVPQVKIINHETNKGVATARNTGLKHATGRYIGWVDSDDWVDTEMFGAMYQKANASNSDIVWCDICFCYGDEANVCKIITQENNENHIDLVKGLIVGRLHGSLCNSIVKRNLYVDHNIIFLPEISLMEDKLISLKLRYYAQKCTYLPCAYYLYNKMNEQSLTMLPDNYDKNLSNGLKTMHLIFSFLETNDKGIDFLQDFVHAKLVFKDHYFNSFTIQGFNVWKQVFPEANKYFFSSPVVPIHKKMIGWMIENNCWWLLKICIKLRNLIKHFYK